MSISVSEAEFLKAKRIPVRLSCILPNQYPLVISLWYIYEDGKIFCASGKSSKIISYLQENSRIGFEVAADSPPYCGIRGYGTAELSNDHKYTMIKRLYSKYFNNTDSELYSFLTDPNRDEMVITIAPEQIYKWNFTNRMKDSRPLDRKQLCP